MERTQIDYIRPPITNNSTKRRRTLRKQLTIKFSLRQDVLFSLFLIVISLFLFINSANQYEKNKKEILRLEKYIDRIERENIKMTKEYNSIDLEKLKETALSIGLVPVESIEPRILDVSTEEKK